VNLGEFLLNCPEPCPQRKTDRTFLWRQHDDMNNSDGGRTHQQQDFLCRISCLDVLREQQPTLRISDFQSISRFHLIDDTSEIVDLKFIELPEKLP
jgi:hypothetical protein